MNVFFMFLGALAMLVAGAVGGMVRDEIRARLTRIPHGVLHLAALLVPADQRDDLRAEWRAEVSATFEETKDVPFTGLVRATWYALGLLARGRAVARELDGTAGERRRQLLDLLTRVKHGARILVGWLGGSGPRRQVMTASTSVGTTTVTRRAALAVSAALAAAAVGIAAPVLAGSGSPPGPAVPGSSSVRAGSDPQTGGASGSVSFNPGSGVDAVALSPDGKTLATTSSDGTVRLWDVDTGQPITVSALGPTALAVAFTPAGKALATTSSDSTIRLWDVESRAARLSASPIAACYRAGGPPVLLRRYIIIDAETAQLVAAAVQAALQAGAPSRPPRRGPRGPAAGCEPLC
jgi:hypothetical protein